jgi:hypothetical protein
MTTKQDDPDWTREEAIALCIAAEQCAAQHGWHVALSGGLLYKAGPRKDADLVVYRHREPGSYRESEVQLSAARYRLLVELARIGMADQVTLGCVVKVRYLSHGVDLIFPEIEGGYE